MSFDGCITSANSFLAELATFLQSQGLGTYTTSASRTIFLMAMPSSPEVCTSIRLTGGTGDERGPTIQGYSVQILHRNTSIGSGIGQAQLIHDSMANKFFGSSGSPKLIITAGRCEPQHKPGPFYLDENARPVYTLNSEWKISGHD